MGVNSNSFHCERADNGQSTWEKQSPSLDSRHESQTAFKVKEKQSTGPDKLNIMLKIILNKTYMLETGSNFFKYFIILTIPKQLNF